MRFDFHLHTNMSDGKVTPEALVFKASARNLDTIALTDHDTTAGFAAAESEGKYYGVHVIPGVELSANVIFEGKKKEPRGESVLAYPEPGENEPTAIHLICLGFDPRSEALQEMLQRIRDARVRAARETLERLRLAGYGVDLAPVDENERALCRPHLADALVKAGHARSRQDAFARFLGGDTYRSHYDLPSSEDAIATVHRAGGVAIYAHPDPDDIDVVAPLLKEQGLDGIEVFRAWGKSSARSLYAEDTGKRLDLLLSGGSDWHGMAGNLGEFFVTESEIGRLAKRL